MLHLTYLVSSTHFSSLQKLILVSTIVIFPILFLNVSKQELISYIIVVPMCNCGHLLCHLFIFNTFDLVDIFIDEFYLFVFHVVDSSLFLWNFFEFRTNSYNSNQFCGGINGFGMHIPRIILERCPVTRDKELSIIIYFTWLDFLQLASQGFTFFMFLKKKYLVCVVIEFWYMKGFMKPKEILNVCLYLIGFPKIREHTMK